WLLITPLMALWAAPASADCALPTEGEGFRSFSKPTIRLEASRLERDGLILYGTVANPSYDKDGKGRTDFLVTSVLREGKVKAPAKLVLASYVPVEDPKKPPHYLVFCGPDKDGLDPYRGVRLKGGPRSLEYGK